MAKDEFTRTVETVLGNETIAAFAKTMVKSPHETIEAAFASAARPSARWCATGASPARRRAQLTRQASALRCVAAFAPARVAPAHADGGAR